MGYNVYGAAMLAFTINLTFIYMASMLYDRTTCKALCKAATVLAEVDNPCPPGFPGRHLSAGLDVNLSHPGLPVACTGFSGG
jgi:hypothetical protein